jgi:hypothetical protein
MKSLILAIFFFVFGTVNAIAGPEKSMKLSSKQSLNKVMRHLKFINGNAAIIAEFNGLSLDIVDVKADTPEIAVYIQKTVNLSAFDVSKLEKGSLLILKLKTLR